VSKVTRGSASGEPDTLEAMSEPRKILTVRLTPSDLVPVIQRKGSEQNANVNGPFTHYAYDQATLLLAAEDLYTMLSRLVNEAKKHKERNPLSGGLSDVMLKEAAELLRRVYFES
jgi:hypothetical protein